MTNGKSQYWMLMNVPPTQKPIRLTWHIAARSFAHRRSGRSRDRLMIRVPVRHTTNQKSKYNPSPGKPCSASTLNQLLCASLHSSGGRPYFSGSPHLANDSAVKQSKPAPVNGLSLARFHPMFHALSRSMDERSSP